MGVLLLTAVFLLPTDRMQAHVAESADAIRSENGTTSELLYGYSGTFNGIFTDCLMLQNAVYHGNHTPLQAAMGAYRSETDLQQWHPADSLLAYLDGEQNTETSYARYWHGYLVILKPLLLFLNFEEIKQLNMIALIILFCLCMEQFGKKGRLIYGWGLIVAVLLMMPVAQILSLSQSVCAYLSLGGMLFLLIREKWVLQEGHFIYVFLILGMLTAYLDFLTFPLITLGLPLTVLLILMPAEAEKGWAGCLKVAETAACWGFGYLGLWASKWGYASVILHTNVFGDAASTLQERTSAAGSGSRLASFVQVVSKNLHEISGLPFKWMTVITLLWLLYLLVKYRKTLQEVPTVPAFFLTAFLPFLWFAVTLNHSYEHAVFTFRILSITEFALVSMILKWLEPGKSVREKNAAGEIGKDHRS